MGAFFTKKMKLGEIFINGEEYNHIVNARRLREGDEVIFIDGKGNKGYGSIKEINFKRKSLKVEIKKIEREKELPEIWLAQSVIKRMDFIIEKATELGVKGIFPIITRYTSFIPERKVERWKRISLSACKQSCRAKLPYIENPVFFEDFLKKSEKFRLKLIADIDGEYRLREIFSNEQDKLPLVVCIGPEGGFKREEINKAKEYGFIPFTLGKKILRGETASIVSLGIIFEFIGEN
ncbi:hypothetical protein DRJ22_05925 [Candidatus Woesearchaeota archaeon]|nr:MAG: hypothetical protein DRJ22_05925 [Candidatus Woesearchaeota archaeon]